VHVPCNANPPSPCSSISDVQRSKEIVDEDEDKWEVIDKYEIIEWDVVGNEVNNDIYSLADDFMHEIGLVMQPDYVGKPEDLYLWCLVRDSKTCLEYRSPMSFSCGYGAGLRITKKGQKIKVGKIRVHDRDSHSRSLMHANKCTPGIREFNSNIESSGMTNHVTVARLVALQLFFNYCFLFFQFFLISFLSSDTTLRRQ
jgi:hypothetical protein